MLESFSNSNKPLVSVIVPSYNHEKFIEESILSIIKQTYTNTELIVVDDGSKDSSPQILKKLQQKYNFILYCRENKGLSVTLNEAINNYSNGKYIRILASDDYWPENSVEDLVNYMEEHPEKAMCFGWAYAVDSNGKVFSKYGNDKKESDITFNKLLEDNFIVAPTTMFRKDIFEELGGFDENLAIEDWDFWLRITFKYPIGFINRHLAFYRKHLNSTTYKTNLMIKAREQTYDKWKNKIDVHTFNKSRSKYLFNYFHKYSIKNKRSSLILLAKYRFQYFDIQMLYSFLKGCTKLIFYWR